MFKVRVIDENGNAFWIETRGDERIGDFRRKVWQKTGVPWSENGRCQRLSLRGILFPILEDSQAINPLIGLENGDTVQLAEDKTALRNDSTYLHLSAAQGAEEAVRFLSEGGGCGTTTTHQLDDELDDYKYTALHCAAMRGQLGVVEDLVGVGMNNDAEGFGGNTPIHLAVFKDDSGTIAALECGGADLEATDAEGYSPIQKAVSFNKCKAMSALIEGGATCPPVAWEGTIYPEMMEAIVMTGSDDSESGFVDWDYILRSGLYR